MNETPASLPPLETIELARPDRTVLRGLRWRSPGGARAVVVHGLGEHAARQRSFRKSILKWFLIYHTESLPIF